METLSGGASTELYQSLVVQDKKASEIHLSFEGDSRGEGSIWLSATPAPHVTLADLEKSISKKLADLMVRGIPAAGIDKAKMRMMDRELYARDSVMGPAMVVGQALSYGLTLEDVETHPDQIAAVSAQDVQRVLKTYLDPEKPAHLPVTGYLVPKSLRSPLTPPSPRGGEGNAGLRR